MRKLPQQIQKHTHTHDVIHMVCIVHPEYKYAHHIYVRPYTDLMTKGDYKWIVIESVLEGFLCSWHGKNVKIKAV